MDKIKKFLAIPLCWHLGVFVAYAFLKSSSTAMMLITVDLMLGLVATPVYLAVLSIIHAVIHEAKVYDYIYSCLGVLFATGLVRGAAYLIFGGGSVSLLLAGGVLVVSVGVFTLWDCIFALTDRMMKKRPGRRK